MEESNNSSKWGVQIHWQDGTDEDFADFPDQMRLAKEKALMKAEKKAAKLAENADKNGDEVMINSSSSEGEEEENELESVANVRKFNHLVDSLTDEEDNGDDNEDDEDPGEDKPEARILWAAQNNNLDIVKDILEKSPVLVGARDEDLYTPLHRAAYSNHIQVVRYLLEMGADPLATTDTGWTPLHSAAKWNNSDIVEVLLNAGTSVNTISEGGLTPLHVAAMSANSRQTIELLLMQPDVDLSLMSNQGDTAQEIAARSGPYAPLFEAAWPRGVQTYRERRN